MFLQASLLTGIKYKYLGMVSIIESEQIQEKIDLIGNIFKFIQFADIKKENVKIINKATDNIFLIASSSKSVNKQNRIGMYINQECINKGINFHYMEYSFLKYPKIRAKYFFWSIRAKRS